MPHLDDGKLNALLDGELEAGEAAAAHAHIASCEECARRLDEARRFLAQATDLLGVLEPPLEAAPGPPAVRRVSKTAKEVALDLDGATQKSPALPPNLRREDAPAAGVFAGHPRRPRVDLATLTWAATVILALGVGYLSNEVRHARRSLAMGEGGPAPSAGSAAGRVPAGGATTGAAEPSSGVQAADRSRAAAAGAASPPPSPAATRRAPSAPRGKRLPQDAATLASGSGAAPTEARAAHPAAEVGGVAAQPRGAPAGAPSAAPPVRYGNALLPTAAKALAAPASPLTAFRRTTLEDAVSRLQGSIRLLDGMRIERVEAGPGYLVPGADRERELVRISYRDADGRRVQLDEQRLGPATDSASEADATAREAAVGLRFGDTLLTAAPNAQVRVRWLDRGGFWLSLTAALPPDTLRRLVERVR